MLILSKSSASLPPLSGMWNNGNYSTSYGSGIGDFEMILKPTCGKSVTALYFPTSRTDGAEVGMFSTWSPISRIAQLPFRQQSHWPDVGKSQLVLSNCTSPLPWLSNSKPCPGAIYRSRASLNTASVTSGTREMVSIFLWESGVQSKIPCSFFLFTWHMRSKDSERWENNMALINDQKKVSDL